MRKRSFNPAPRAATGVSGAGSAKSVAATDAKNAFGEVLDRAMQDGMVIITKHDSPKAVLLSVDRFNSLSGIRHDSLASLTAEYDAMFKRMQSPQSQAAMQKAFRATPKLLGKAAVSAARKGA